MILVTSTVVLLVARIKVMGAQLPVFTRYVVINKRDFYFIFYSILFCSSCV